MKSNKFFKYLALPALSAVMLSGCSDDFLKPDPLSFYEPATTFSTESGLRAALAITDRHMRLPFTSDNTNNCPYFSDMLFSDICMYGKTDAGGGFRDNFAGNLTPTSWIEKDFNDTSMLGWLWYNIWDHVKYANTVLDNIDNVKDLDESIKAEYEGRALFHRAWAYYILCHTFGDVPLVSHLPSEPKQNYKSCPALETMKMMAADLKRAVDMVPAQSEMTYYGMVNKESVRHLYAKILLITGDYKEAENQCTILIEQSGLSLMKEPFGNDVKSGEPKTWDITRNVIWDLHRPENKIISANKEYILGMPNISEQSLTSFPVMRVTGPLYVANIITPDNKGNAIDRISRKDANYTAENDWIRAAGRGIGTFRPTHWAQHGLWVVNGKTDATDLRHSHEAGNWLRMEDMTYTNKNSKYFGQKLIKYAPEDIWNKKHEKITLHKGAILVSDTLRSWYDVPLYKMWYLDAKNEADLGANDFQGVSTGSNGNMYVYRLAETYLLRAEARLYQGNAGGAANDVNEIRKRAKCTELYSTVNIGDIMDERARELYLEEWRHVELVRVSRILAMNGIADEWGNVYNKDTWDKQSGTDLAGGSYWYQRLMHHNVYNHGKIISGGKEFNYQMDKKNIFWPIPNDAIVGNVKGELKQNYGYTGYNPNVEMWSTWQEADADCE